jgi:cyclopropane-fatty-acyl-phospholipid synthase
MDKYKAAVEELISELEGVSTLSEAQEQKLKLICEKMQLKPGQIVLDIGCGWCGFAYYAAKNYKVNVVGVTISAE